MTNKMVNPFNNEILFFTYYINLSKNIRSIVGKVHMNTVSNVGRDLYVLVENTNEFV